MMKLRSGRFAHLLQLSVFVVTGLGLFGATPHVRAQAATRTATKFYPDFSDTADALLRNAASHARDHQWAEAVEIYQRVIQQFGDKVAKLPKDDPASDPTGDSLLYVDLRQFCQRRLAALPAEARAIYRGRIDPQAERWFQQASADRDRFLLRKIIEQAFCSSRGDDALDLLGDLAFQDGRFDEALALYRQLVPDRADDRTGLNYPDPSVDLARVAAKKLLSRAALGEDPPGRAELEAYAKAYAGASGALAGRTGPYSKILTEALQSDHLAPPSQPDGRWPTFAGAPTRTKVLPGPIDVGSLQWKVELPAIDAKPGRNGGFNRMGLAAPPVTPDRLLAYHPIVLGDQVLVCDEGRILAFPLNDRPDDRTKGTNRGVEPAWKSDGERRDVARHAARFAAGVPRYTLTAFGDRVYARLGPTNWPTMGGMRPMGGEAQSYLLAIERSTEGKQLWTKRAVEVPLPKRQADSASRTTGFEGTPVADARSVYVAMTDRREQTATYVACLDADTGEKRWVRYLGAASSDAINGMGMGGFGAMNSAPPSDFGHRLLTLDGPTVYYQTNLGAVIALDAESGGIRWVATYPRQERNGLAEGCDRDLNPAIVHDGLVIVAPDDAAAIFAFDAGSGRLLWKTDPIPDEVRLAHVLGVAQGRLIATGDRVLLFDVKNGKLVQTWPDSGSGRAYTGYGRGLLAGDKIYWPTRTEIHILDQATGLRTDPPIRLAESFQTSGGNLAVGDGYLIVAQPDALVVFCQNSRLIERYREEIARVPDQASNYYRLAQAAEAVGDDRLALGSLEQALAKTRPSEGIDGVPLVEAARDHQFRLLMKLGQKAKAVQDWAPAAGRFEAASVAARSDRDRLAARLLLAGVALDRGDPRVAVETLQALLADDRLRTQNVVAEDGHRTIRANILIADRLASILRDRGRLVYLDFDKKAAALLERGRAEKDPRLLEEVARNYPAALVVPESLLALGALNEGLHRPTEAARAYKRLLAASPGDTLRARALWGLGRAYEAQKLWVPARDTYIQAQTRFADVLMEEFGTGAKLGRLVADRLAREPFDRMTADRSEPSLPVPLVRRWARTLPESYRPLEAEGVPPSADAGRFFLVQGSTIRPVEPATGEALWSTDLGGTPIWVGYLADKILAATDSRLLALSLDRGAIEWQYDLGPNPPGRRDADPFAKPTTGPEPADPTRTQFHDFRIVGGRVFCQVGARKLLAFDGDTGLVDWSFTPPSGAINPNLWVGPNRIVLQTVKPHAVLVLETAGGRRRAEYPQADGEEWARPPLPIDDDHVALVLDRRTVALFDWTRGTNAWVFRESDKLPTHGPPRLVGDAERLLAIHDGNELIRLDPATGLKLWSRPLGGEDLGEHPEAFAFDLERFYWAGDRLLRSLSLADGAPGWAEPLTGPESGWCVSLTERCVMTYPRLSNRKEGNTEALPLVFRRRETGELVQRLSFPTAGADVSVRLAPRGALVAAQGGLWALGEGKPRSGPMNRNP